MGCLKTPLLIVVAFIVVWLVMMIPGVDDDTPPQPSPTTRSDPDYEPAERGCSNWFYC